MTVRIGSFSRMCMSRSWTVPCGNQVQQKRGKIRKRRPKRWGAQYVHPAFWYVPIAAITSTSIQPGQPRYQVFQLFQLTRATGGPVTSTLMSGWIFWNRWCLVRSSG
jgi:hypothetical protein